MADGAEMAFFGCTGGTYNDFTAEAPSAAEEEEEEEEDAAALGLLAAAEPAREAALEAAGRT